MDGDRHKDLNPQVTKYLKEIPNHPNKQKDFRNTMIFKTMKLVEDRMLLLHNRPIKECERGRKAVLLNGPHRFTPTKTS